MSTPARNNIIIYNIYIIIVVEMFVAGPNRRRRWKGHCIYKIYMHYATVGGGDTMYIISVGGNTPIQKTAVMCVYCRVSQ